MIDNHTKKISAEFANLCKYNATNISNIEKIMSKKEIGEYSNKQIFEDVIQSLNDNYSKLLT